jgi:hypothetical protein
VCPNVESIDSDQKKKQKNKGAQMRAHDFGEPK